MDFLQTAINGCGSVPNQLIFILIGIAVLTISAVIMEKYYEKKNKT